MNKITIAVDAMGGDHGPPVIIPAVLQVLKKHPNLHLVLVGDKDILQKTLSLYPKVEGQNLSIHHATQTVEMHDSPAHALRTKKDSSMRVAINLVKNGTARACVSAGNTGALVATARFVLKTIAGIDRPAIVSVFPTRGKDVRLLDLGANVDSTAENLFQFAVMGSVLASAVENIHNPKVYLLNIGEEDIKGNEQVKETAQLLQQSSMLNYIGYIEGDELFDGQADVIVCDGFVGNVALKTCEGVVSFIGQSIKEAYKRNLWTKLVGLLSLPILKFASKRIDPSRYNGATLIGLQGIVIKSHGSANKIAFANAIEQAILQVEKNIPERIGSEVERLLKLSKLENPNPS